MVLVWETWDTFLFGHEVHHETPITALFRDTLIKAYVAAGRNWFVTLEDPITDPTYGTQNGRNDIRLYPPAHYGQTIFFTVECKRLRVQTKSGLALLANEYVDDGIQRFVEGRYSAGLPCGGMLGYVMDDNVSEALATVQSAILSKRVALKIPNSDGVRMPSSVLPDCESSIDTVHLRSDGEFTIHHVLVGVKRKAD